MVFLNFQRLPSLKAGIFSSYTYLYSVSGLTPRYCEAWRMFITSRESAPIKSVPFDLQISDRLLTARAYSQASASSSRGGLARTEIRSVSRGDNSAVRVIPRLLPVLSMERCRFLPCFLGVFWKLVDVPQGHGAK